MPTAQIGLLKSIEDVSNKAKALVLLPTFDSLIEDRSSSGVANHYDQCLEEFASLVVSSFDASVSNDLNDQNEPLWNVFISTLRYYFTSGAPTVPIASSLVNATLGRMPTPRIILTRTLEHDLFVSLKLEHKIEVCELLLKMGAQDPAAVRTEVYKSFPQLEFTVALVCLLQKPPVEPLAGRTSHGTSS